MQVQLFKKEGTYPDKKTGKDKPYTNFYVKCGDALIPVEVCYFPNEKCEGRDPQYNGRKQVLSAFAAILPDLPDKPDNGKATQGAVNTAAAGDNAAIEPSQPIDDNGLPI